FSDCLFFVCLLTLAPILGLLGVAAAGALSTSFSNIAAVHIMKRQIGIRWLTIRNQRQYLPLILCILAMLLISYADLVHGAWGLVFALVAAYAVFFLAYLSGGLSRE